MKMSRLVPAEEQLVLLNSNTTLILKTNIFLKLLFSNFVTSIKVEGRK